MKTIENRVWSTDFRGEIALHASTSKTGMNAFRKESGLEEFSEEQMPTGVILGVIDILEVEVYGPNHEADPFAFGPYCWKMGNGKFLRQPIPLKGKLNLFSLDESLGEQIAAAEKFQIDLSESLKWKAVADAVTPSVLEDYYEPYVGLIEHFWPKGKHFEEMRIGAQRIIESYPDEAVGYALAAALGDGVMSVEDRETNYRRALEIEPKYAFALVELGRLHQRKGEPELAGPLAERAIQTAPDSVEAFALRSSNRVLLGDFELALDDACRIVELDPKSAYGYELQGEALAGLGKVDEAIRQVENGLKILPQNIVLQTLLERLRDLQ